MIAPISVLEYGLDDVGLGRNEFCTGPFSE